MSPFQLQPGEKLIVNDPWASWIKNATSEIKGQLKLTDRRLVFVKNATPFLSLFLSSKKSCILFDYPFAAIKNFSRKKLFKSEELVIDNGIDRPVSFTTSKMDTFEAGLKERTGNSKES